MAQMTDSDRASSVSAEEFYDSLAIEYDRMTGFAQRFVQERPFFKLLLDRYEIRKAVDAGCGTGFHSLLLAELGADVVAVDVSARMLEELQRHAHEMNLRVKTVRAPLEDLAVHVPPEQDAVFCLGNTLAHFLTPGRLSAAMRSCSHVLKPGGVLFVQVLNYERILAAKELVQSVREQDGAIFVRMYEYRATNIVFHILRLDRTQAGIQHSIRSVVLYPLRSQELIASLQAAAFDDIRLFGGIRMDDFDPRESRDLVIMARRPA